MASSGETIKVNCSWFNPTVPQATLAKAISACDSICQGLGKPSFPATVSQVEENPGNVRMGLMGWTWQIMVLLGCQKEVEGQQPSRNKKGLGQEGQEKEPARRTRHHQGQKTRHVPWLRCYALVFLTGCLLYRSSGRFSCLAESSVRTSFFKSAVETPGWTHEPDEVRRQAHGRIGQGEVVQPTETSKFEAQGAAKARATSASSSEEEVTDGCISRTYKEAVVHRDAKVPKGNGRDRIEYQRDAGALSKIRSWRRGRGSDPTVCGHGRRPCYALGFGEPQHWRCRTDCPASAGEERHCLHCHAAQVASRSYDESGHGTMDEQSLRSTSWSCRATSRIAIESAECGCQRQQTPKDRRSRSTRDCGLPTQGSRSRPNGLNTGMDERQVSVAWLVFLTFYNKCSLQYIRTPENSSYRPTFFGRSGSLEGIYVFEGHWSRFINACVTDFSDDPFGPGWLARNEEGCTSLAVAYTYIVRGVIAEGCTSYISGYNYTYPGSTRHAHIERMLWSLRFMMYVNIVSGAALTVFQGIAALGQRLCFLQFDKGPHSKLDELCFQLVRAFFWSCTTLVYLAQTMRRRQKAIKIVQKRRHSLVCRRYHHKISRTHAVLAVLVLNSHVVQAISRADIPNSNVANTPMSFMDSNLDVRNAVDDLLHGRASIPHGTCYGQNCTPGSSTSSEEEEDRIIHEPKGSRLFEDSLLKEAQIDTAIYDLPNTLGEALAHPRTLRLLNSWQGLQLLLVARGYSEDEVIHYQTYGLRGEDRGQRAIQLRTRNSGDLIGAMRTLWHDEILDRSFQIHVIDPQPIDIPFYSVALLIEIYDLTVDVDFMAPILLEYITILRGGTDTDYTLRTDYTPRRSTSEDIYDLARISRICPPLGTMRCQIETANDISIRRDDQLNIRSGFYIVVQTTPSEWYDFDCTGCFYGVEPFAREASTLIVDPEDPYVFVRTFATFSGDRRVERRGFMLHRRFFYDVEAVWHLATTVWNDRCLDDTMRIVYSPTPPQIEKDNEVSLLVLDGPQIGCLPILMSYLDIDDPNTTWNEGSDTFLIHAPPDVRTTTLHQIAATSYQLEDGQTWCEDGYYDVEDPLPIAPGSHVLIYYTDSFEIEEETEESTISDDPCFEGQQETSSSWRTTSWWTWIILATVRGRGCIDVILLTAIISQDIGGVRGETGADGNNTILPGFTTPCEPRKQRLPDDPIPCGQAITICPLPQTPVEAWEQRPPRTGIWDYEGLRVMLAAERIAIHQPAVLDTYGLHEHSVGYRRVTVTDLQQRTIALAIAATWNDYSFQFSLAARVVRPQPRPLTQPQPIVILIIQILDPFAQIDGHAIPVLIDQVTSADFEDARQAMTVRVAEYIQTPIHGGDIAGLVRMGRSCQPKGLRPCHVHWRGERYDMTTQISPRASEYIVLTASPLGLHFRGADSYFFRARRFALDGQRSESRQ